jgi:hypothetical protein
MFDWLDFLFRYIKRTRRQRHCTPSRRLASLTLSPALVPPADSASATAPRFVAIGGRQAVKITLNWEKIKLISLYSPSGYIRQRCGPITE